MKNSSSVLELSGMLDQVLSGELKHVNLPQCRIQYPTEGYIIRETAQQLDPGASREEVVQVLRDMLGVPVSLSSDLIEVAVKTADKIHVDPFSEVVDLVEAMITLFTSRREESVAVVLKMVA